MAIVAVLLFAAAWRDGAAASEPLLRDDGYTAALRLRAADVLSLDELSSLATRRLGAAPFVMRGSRLAAGAVGNWTIDWLTANIAPGRRFRVLTRRDGRMLYDDDGPTRRDARRPWWWWLPSGGGDGGGAAPAVAAFARAVVGAGAPSSPAPAPAADGGGAVVWRATDRARRRSWTFGRFAAHAAALRKASRLDGGGGGAAGLTKGGGEQPVAYLQQLLFAPPPPRCAQMLEPPPRVAAATAAGAVAARRAAASARIDARRTAAARAAMAAESPWARAPLVEVASSSVGMSRGRRLGTVEGARTARRFCASA